MAEKTVYLANYEDVAALKKTSEAQAKDIETLKSETGKKANGAGITLSITESGGLRVTYDDGK